MVGIGWAMLIYALLAVAAVYGIILQMRHRYRIRQEIEVATYPCRTDKRKPSYSFSLNISHEIRTPMSLIISPLQKLMTNDTDHERQKNYASSAQFRKNPAAGKPIDGYTQDRQRTDVTRFP